MYPCTRRGENTITTPRAVTAVILATLTFVLVVAVPAQAGFIPKQIKTQVKDVIEDHASEAAVKLKDGGEHGHPEPTFNNPAKGYEESSSIPSGGAGGELASIRACESGGDYTIDTGNGFLGAYQFMQSTWDSAAAAAGYGEYVGTPVNQVPPGVQDAVAQAHIDAGHRGAWPNC